MKYVQPSINPPLAMWQDNTNGVTYEFDYIVTQQESEGPEYIMYRPLWNGQEQAKAEWLRTDRSEREFPDMVIDQVVEFFNGAPKSGLNPDQIPNIWATFAQLRSYADDLAGDEYIDRGTELVIQVAEFLKSIGNLDEPLTSLIEAALDNSLTPANRELLRYISDSQFD